MDFVRAFGLHRPEETPCGAQVPVSEAHALTILLDEGPMAQTDLAHRLELAKSTVSRLVDLLEDGGWAQRQIGDTDSRRRLVELTAEGEKRANEIVRLRRARLSRLFDQIPPADRSQVLAALDTLVEAARESRDV